jgi:nucleotide-binding universal stress UspA family protein
MVDWYISLYPMKKVLIALDYNPTAQKVAETGYTLAKSLNAEVTLLHVLTDPVFYATSEFSPIMGYDGYVDVSPTVLDSIEGLKGASLQYLDIIVIGSHSQKWLENILMGSVTEKVMHLSTIPLFIIPTRKK